MLAMSMEFSSPDSNCDCSQGIIDCKGTETRQIFSCMFVMAKEIK